MYGFYEEKPESGTVFLDENEEEDTVEIVYDFDEDEGAWNVLAEEAGRVQIQYEDGQWVQV